jgi:transcriptional regulator with XRE-family HTH domain
MSISRSDKHQTDSARSEERLKRDFPKRLRGLRESRKQTQSQVAKALGFASESVYQLWEKGGGNLPSALNLHKLADYFQVTTDFLLGRQEESPAEPLTTEQPDEGEKAKARRRVFEYAWHGKNWDAKELEPLLLSLYRSEEPLARCYDRVITDVFFSARPEALPPLSAFQTPAARAIKAEIEHRFQDRPIGRARSVTMHVLDLEQVPSERFQRTLIGMQGAQLMKDRMTYRQKAFTLAVSNGWLARDVLLAPNLERGDIENVTVIPLTLGRSQPDETSTTTIIGQFAYKHGDYGVKPINLTGRSAVLRVAGLAPSIDLAFMGAGAVELEGRKSVFADLLAEKQLDPEDLAAQGIIGNVLYHLIREHPSGTLWEVFEPEPEEKISMDIDERGGDEAVGDEILRVLKLEKLRELVEVFEAQVVLLIQDKGRARIARAALEKRWANNVICTLAVAQEMLRLLSEKPL